MEFKFLSKKLSTFDKKRIELIEFFDSTLHIWLNSSQLHINTWTRQINTFLHKKPTRTQNQIV